MKGTRTIKILRDTDIKINRPRTLRETLNSLKINSINDVITIDDSFIEKIAKELNCAPNTIYCSIIKLKNTGYISIISKVVERERTVHCELDTKDNSYNYFAVAKSKYGIDKEALEEIWREQREKCPICGKSKEPSGKRFHIDHDHTTGIIRGLLCSKCNMGIGIFDENIERLRSAISYLSNNF
jgi:hypothetical protein